MAAPEVAITELSDTQQEKKNQKCDQDLRELAT